jgi:hypothetical protein
LRRACLSARRRQVLDHIQRVISAAIREPLSACLRRHAYRRLPLLMILRSPLGKTRLHQERRRPGLVLWRDHIASWRRRSPHLRADVSHESPHGHFQRDATFSEQALRLWANMPAALTGERQHLAVWIIAWLW